MACGTTGLAARRSASAIAGQPKAAVPTWPFAPAGRVSSSNCYQHPSQVSRYRLKLRPKDADFRLMDPSSIALQALQQADVQLETAAARIASSNSPDAGNLDVVDLSAEMVALMSAQNLFDVNLATLKTANQIQKNMMDVKPYFPY